MNCINCGKILEGKQTKYCSEKCRENFRRDSGAYRTNENRMCECCGKIIPKWSHKYCSSQCKKQVYNQNQNREPHGELTKICVECGKEFKTYKNRKITCSKECSEKHHNCHRTSRTSEQERARYLKNHPNAKTKDEIHLAAEKRKAEKAEKSKLYWEAVEKKAQEREANRRYWTEFCEQKVCPVCRKEFTSNYPTKIYCSDKCSKIKSRQEHPRKQRYEKITIDSDITIKKLAKRDHGRCKLCGLFVNWDDKFINENGTVICGNEYPSIDHIVPISLGGVHSWDNVQLAHRYCNTLKSNKYIG